MTYELFEAALTNSGIDKSLIMTGSSIAATASWRSFIPSTRAKALLLNRAIPLLSQLLSDYNASLPQQRQLRIRDVLHAGEVRYDANGCFGEALDVGFRLLDAVRVKRRFRAMTDPPIPAVSQDIHSSVVRHGYDGIDNETFHQLVGVRLPAGLPGLDPHS